MNMTALDDLNQSIIACARCPRLVAHRRQVAREKRRAFQDQTYWGKPVPSFGDPRAQVLLVGLAPGAHGSNRTGRMFTGDGSGDFLTPALHRAGYANQPSSNRIGDGLKLANLCVVAVAHCAPPGNKPTAQEIANCRPFLVAHLERLQRVRVILALGKVAFDGTLAALAEAGLAVPKPRPRFGHGAQYALGKYTLIGSYHPSRQNTQTGRLTEAMFDAVFRQVNAVLEK